MRKGTKFAFTSTMKQFLFALFFLTMGILSYSGIQAQNTMETKNGWNMAPNGKMHVLIIFTELIFDSSYANLNPVPVENYQWKENQLPAWKNDLFSPTPDGKAFMTQYFRDASFGNFQVTGDYLDTLVQVKISEIRNEKGAVVSTENYGNNYFRKAVIAKANSIQNPRLHSGTNWSDFDHWTFSKPGKEKMDTANGKWDLIMIIFRNIHCPGMGDHSGFVQEGSVGTLWGFESDMFSIFRTSNYLPSAVTRHEFSHMLYGGNNFHTANGGVGQRTFLGTIGGYSNMSAADAMSPVWNAWDRERMNWKNPENEFLINCHCEDGSQIEGTLTYGEDKCPGGIYVLNDFVSKGDFLKIKIPHLPANIKQQYLWLENHQRIEGYTDHTGALPKGLFSYISVGKDKLSGGDIFGGENNYIWPIAPIGNYDFLFNLDSMLMIIKQERQNPFTGAHYFMRVPWDLNNDGLLNLTVDNGNRTEYVLAKNLEIDGQSPPDDYFSYMRYSQFGTRDGGFTPDGISKFGLSYNPAATPVYTFSTCVKPSATDNRRIYLNGISVEVLEMKIDGPIKIKIRWDDFDIVQNLRWCGDILSKESIHLLEKQTIFLDQGYSIQQSRPVQKIGEENIFAEPTILQLDSGSKTILEKKSRILVGKGSTLLIKKGASLSIGEGAYIVVEAGGYLYIEDGAEVKWEGSKSGIAKREGANTGINPILAKKFSNLGIEWPGYP